MSSSDWGTNLRLSGNYGIGSRAPRVDAATKVTGKEKYAADYYPEHFVWAGVKRSAYPHARLLKIDGSKALDVPGVLAVITGEDIQGTNRLGIFEKDQPILTTDVVRHYGDAVALVVAETKVALAEALALIWIDYEELPAVFSPEEAMAMDAPIIHTWREQGNVLLQEQLIEGTGATALQACAYTAEVKVHIGWQEHAFLETENGVAWVDQEGVLTLVVSTQTPFRDRLELATALGLPPSQIRVTAPYLGGGFGGKDGITVQGFLALAALNSKGRPVKIQYSREESFLAGTKRHPISMRYLLGCTQEGLLEALSCDLLFDTGAYASLGAEVFALALEHAGGPYRVPNISIKGSIVYTNNPVSGAFRGFGVPQVMAGIEQVVDELALKSGFDPLEFRLKNSLRRGERVPAGVILSQSVGLGECLRKVQEHKLWQNRKEWQASAPAYKIRGVGLAAALHGQGFGPVIPDYANAKLEITRDGQLKIDAGVVDMGQGNATTYLQMVSHILCQDYSSMELILPDTSKTLPSASSSASRTTFTYGKALVGAAHLLKDRILHRATLLLSFQLLETTKPEELILLPGRVVHAPTGKEISLKMITSSMDTAERVVTNSYTCPSSKQVIGSKSLRTHGFGHRIFSFAVQLIRLEIDSLSGEITLCDSLSCIEAGKVINPQLFEQQIQGGVAQGLGYALFEDFRVSDGRILTDNLTNYILPTSLDLPKMQIIAIELSEEDGPFGMKGVGEISVDAVFPAVANAVACALGSRISDGTISAEKILAVLRAQGRDGQ